MGENNINKAKFPSLWWRDAVAKVVFLYVVFQFLRQFYAIYEGYLTVRNPLFPSYLSDYIAFPHYFLICFWGVAVYLFYKFMKDTRLQQERFWVIPVSLVAFLLGSFFLYLFLMEVNPLG